MSGSFDTTRQVTARKDHRCGECFRVIASGETYERAAGVWEGDFWHLKSCAQCSAFRDIIDQVDPDFHEYMYGGVQMWVQEIGSSAAEVGYGFRHARRCTPLSLYRWSRQFTARWHDGADPIPTVKEAIDER